MFETFDHTADLGLRIRAESLEKLFEEAASALFSVILENPKQISSERSFSFRIEGSRNDELLLDWLDELLFKFASEHVVLCSFSVQFTESGLNATSWGEQYRPDIHGFGEEIKAITYHGLKVENLGDMWLGEIIVDL
ncbi:MAG: archease [Pirellulales bacterium]|nr:archease [Pirellulales bacterium]